MAIKTYTFYYFLYVEALGKFITAKFSICKPESLSVIILGVMKIKT
jgi:hypothetical protein